MGALNVPLHVRVFVDMRCVDDEVGCFSFLVCVSLFARARQDQRQRQRQAPV